MQTQIQIQIQTQTQTQTQTQIKELIRKVMTDELTRAGANCETVHIETFQYETQNTKQTQSKF